MVQNLWLTTDFSTAYGSRWGFAYTKLWYQRELENWSWPKRSGSSTRKFYFSKIFPQIVCAWIATQHAHCHKEYYSPRGQAVSTNHFCVHAQRFFASAKRFCIFKGHFSSTDVTFQQNFVIFKFSTSWPKTLDWLHVFPLHMDRAEV